MVMHATGKPLQRLGPHTMAADGEMSTALLGDWYATYLPWRPRQVALLVSERTLLPLSMPLAPASTLLDRVPGPLTNICARASALHECRAAGHRRKEPASHYER